MAIQVFLQSLQKLTEPGLQKIREKPEKPLNVHKPFHDAAVKPQKKHLPHALNPGQINSMEIALICHTGTNIHKYG